MEIISGIRITHPDRVLFPAARLKKIDLVRYYDRIADWILPHLAGRPLTLKQCAPDADHCRYLRHSGERAPADVRVVKIQEQTKVGDYMVVDTRAALIALAQRNIVEFHTWNATVGQLEQPDRVVLDLDPGPEVPWRDLVAAAHDVRAVFQDLRLRSWVKTTGGTGLHVVVPIAPRADWRQCLEFARAVAHSLVQHAPSRYTAKYAKRGREKLILVDYLRNNRTNTSVAAYSVRARRTAPVSVPIDWDALTPRLRPERWTIRTLPAHLERAPDPWADYGRERQSLPLESTG